MLCVEDALDALNWVKSIGGLNSLIEKSNKSFNFVSKWIDSTSWLSFLNEDTTLCSNTSITFKINDAWFTKKNIDEKKEIMKKTTKLLEEENIANDINGYAKAPPSFRIWAGGTVESSDIQLLLPWIEWAYKIVKSNYNN